MPPTSEVLTSASLICLHLRWNTSSRANHMPTKEFFKCYYLYITGYGGSGESFQSFPQCIHVTISKYSAYIWVRSNVVYQFVVSCSVSHNWASFSYSTPCFEGKHSTIVDFDFTLQPYRQISSSSSESSQSCVRVGAASGKPALF